LNQCTHDKVASALSKLSATVPIDGRAPISSRRSVNRTDVNCDPASECATRPTKRWLPRARLAISSASRTMSVRMWAATRHSTIIRENACIITASRTARADGANSRR
jgi:hypothetical protein